jgi:hypothetical protein
MRRAIELGLPDHLLFRVMWDIAALEKKLKRTEAAAAIWKDLAASPNPFQARARALLVKLKPRPTM